MNAAVKRLQAGIGLGPTTQDDNSAPFSWSRFLKLGGALALLGIGAYATFSDQANIATNQAVVTAYAVTLRTPIDGVVTAAELRVGQQIKQGEHIGHIDNARVDDQRVEDLRAQIAKSEASAAATSKQISAFYDLRNLLRQRAEEFRTAVLARLSATAIESEGLLTAAKARLELASRSLQRRKSLGSTGFTSVADLDTAESQYNAVSGEVLAHSGRLAAVDSQIEAARRGIVADTNASDVAYSSQRADELSIRISELDRELELYRTDIVQTRSRLAIEQARIARLKTAELAAPASGIIWKLDASNGERLATGTDVAQIVDCNASFIMAAIPQNRVPDVEIGSEVQYRLSGDKTKRFGRVVSVIGDAADSGRNLAAMPLMTSGTSYAIVRIAIEAANQECFVGRTARVIIPSAAFGISHFITGLL